MKTIAIIPARGGSKRLKGKNLKIFSGLPLVVHSIKYALSQPSLIDKVFVSTNDITIKKEALKYGAEVIDRPEILSSDTATTVSVLNHVLDNLNSSVENVILLQPTSPLRPDSLLPEALNAYFRGNYDSLMTVTSTSKKIGKILNGKFSPLNYTLGQRSQDLEELFFENGLLYIIKSTILRQEKILGDNHFPFILNHPFSMVDIDTEEDLIFAEMVFKNIKKWKHRN